MDRKANQAYLTPFWAAEALVERYFRDLGPTDLVLEPTCGDGAFLAAIPASVPAVGVELDPELAALARRNSGRTVLEGDFRTVPLTLRPTAVIGNPPFRLAVFDGILERCRGLLPDGAQAGFILPAYAFKTASRVVAYSQQWSMRAELIPQTLFRRLAEPLVFVMFRKDLQRTLVGFALYGESDAVERMPPGYRALLERSRGSAWRTAVAQAMIDLNGEASLDQIYARMEPRRPTANRFWQERVREVLQKDYYRTGKGRYSIQAPLLEAA